MARDDDLAHDGGIRLSAAMSRNRMGPTELAARSGVSQSSISAYTRGETLPNRRTAYAIAATLRDPALLQAWGRPDLALALRNDIEEGADTSRPYGYEYEVPPPLLRPDADTPPTVHHRDGSWVLPIQPPPTYHPGDNLGVGVVIGRLNFGSADTYLVRNEDGRVFIVRPVWGIESFDRLGFE